MQEEDGGTGWVRSKQASAAAANGELAKLEETTNLGNWEYKHCDQNTHKKALPKR